MSSLDETTRHDERVSEIIARFLDAREAGAAPSPEEILAQYPQFKKELKDFFENEEFIRDVLTASDIPPCFGDDYDALEEIGRGGMGVVYKCRQKSLDKVVAIKTITGHTAPDIERIHKEAQRAAHLPHPNIVTVHDVKEHKGQHFFVMEYIEGENLADLIREQPLPSAKAVQYVKTIADAVHYAHQRQILHCDLKPANILVDKEGKPYVTDFGLAKRMGEDGKYLPHSAVGGTAAYMAPEQVAGGELTTATDIYGLGAIFYTLLTGSPLFRAKTAADTLKMVLDEPPKPPSERNPKIDTDLEAICLKCLNKDKDQRYGSAYGLAMDLSRYQAGEETTARRWSQSERTIRWCRRNPVVTGLVSAVAIISILTVVMALLTAQTRKTAQLQEALRSNSFAARDLAKTALLQITDLSGAIEKAAADRTLSKVLESKNQLNMQRYVQRICGGRPLPFLSCFVLDAAGTIVARVENGNFENIAGDLSWRDYFQGARAHAGLEGRLAVHIAKVYRGVNDGLYKFVISAPILDGNEKFVGVICTSVTTDATLGPVITEDARRRVALIAPEDKENPDQTEPGKAVVLFHPAYGRGVTPVATTSPIPSKTLWIHAEELNDSKLLLPARDDYVDPVGSAQTEYQGRWIAGFAPVGNTGLVVVVQQRYDKVLALDPSTFHNLIVWAAVVVFLAITILALVLWRWTRRSSTPNLV